MNYYHNVQYYETDKMGIVHHSNYIRWMEEARMFFLSEVGWNYATFEANGIISPVVSVKCDYKKTVTFDEKIKIDIFVKKVTAVKLIFGYKMFKENGELCTEGESSHCFLKKNGKFVKLKLEYPEFYKQLEELIE